MRRVVAVKLTAHVSVHRVTKNNRHSRVPLVRTGTERSKPVLQNGLGARHWQTEGPAPPNQRRLVHGFSVKRKAVNTHQ